MLCLAIGLIGGNDGQDAIQEAGARTSSVRDVVRGVDVVLLRIVPDRRGVGEELDESPPPAVPPQGRTPTPAAEEPPHRQANDGRVVGEVVERDVAVGGTVSYTAPGEAVDVWITIYLCPPYCGLMANGEPVYDGAAACGYGFSLGQRFRIENDPTLRDYVCSDRGLGAWHWVDIFWADAARGYTWLAQVGDYGTVILR